MNRAQVDVNVCPVKLYVTKHSIRTKYRIYIYISIISHQLFASCVRQTQRLLVPWEPNVSLMWIVKSVSAVKVHCTKELVQQIAQGLAKLKQFQLGLITVDNFGISGLENVVWITTTGYDGHRG